MIPITNGWVVYKPNHSQVTFEEFIELYDPSKMANRESAWIAAESPNHNMLHEAVSDVPSLIVAWESLPPEGKSADLLESLAKEYNVVVGKWMLFTSRDKAKDTWKRIAKDVTEGNLGSSAKISTLSNDSKQQHVICVYTRDYTDQEDVLRVRMRLRTLGFTRKLHYKADAYTYCNIYANNPWHIAPSRYSE